jgi:hypothetical protein
VLSARAQLAASLQGFDDMGFRMELNGQPKQINTSNVDRLAREGIVLDSYYVQCVCSPSRVTFFWPARASFSTRTPCNVCARPPGYFSSTPR